MADSDSDADADADADADEARGSGRCRPRPVPGRPCRTSNALFLNEKMVNFDDKNSRESIQ